MNGNDDFLLDIAGAVSDGEPVDWGALSQTPDAASRHDLLEEMAILARVADLHRRSAGAPAPVNDERPTTWGPLTVLGRIGEGAFGEVFRARDERLDREVALKLLRSVRSDDTEADAVAAIEEGRLLARVRHPNVVTVYGAERLDGRVGIWMELIDGHTLAALAAERGPMSAEEVVGIGCDLCQALGAVHDAGLLHRDVKAQNVMRETNGRIVLMDFGTGRDVRSAMTEDGDLSGTPLYLAPELYAGSRATQASDIYAVAVLLFYLLTGRHPVSGRTVDELVEHHRAGRTCTLHDLRPDLPEGLVAAIERGLSSDPAERYTRAADFASALEMSCRPSPPPPAVTRRAPISRSTVIVGGLIALVVAGTAAFGISLLRHRDAATSSTPTSGPFPFRVIDAYFKGAKMNGPAAVQISPNGELAAYVRPRPVPAIPGDDHPTVDRVFVRNLATGSERQLLDLGRSDARVNELVWSPDSQSVAVVGCHGRLRPLPLECPREDTSELRILPAAGGSDRLLETSPTGIEYVSWSPDSRHVTFEVSPPKAPLEVHVRDVSAHEAAIVVPGASGLSWSHDGHQLAWVQHAMGPRPEIVVAGIDGHALRSIPLVGLPVGHEVESLDWTPDDQIAIRVRVPRVSNDEYLVAASGAVRDVVECRGPFGGDACGSITLGGRFMERRLNATGGGRTVFRDLVSGEDHPLTDDIVSENVVVRPATATGLVAFNSNRDGKEGVYVAPMDRIPVERPVWIADGAARVGGWTSTGLVAQFGVSSSNVYRLNLDPKTGKPTAPFRRLTHDAQHNDAAAISPDGRQVAYMRRTSSELDSLAIMDVSGIDEHDVFSFRLDQGPNYVAWRSPADLLLVRSTDLSAVMSIATFDLASKTSRPLTPLRLDNRRGAGAGMEHPVPPVLVPATGEIFYWDARDPRAPAARIRAKSTRTGAERVIDMPAASEAFVVSADGSLIAYSTFDTSRHPAVGDLRVRRVDGGPERVLVRFENGVNDEFVAPLAFSPDGKFLIYRDPKPVLRMLDMQTTESWPLVVDAPSGVDFGWSNVAWAPDGSFVLLTGLSTTTEWRSYEGLTRDAVIRLMSVKK